MLDKEIIMENRDLTIVTQDGTEILCEVLFTNYSEQFNKHYLVFVEKGTDNASAAIFDPNETENAKLKDIETEEEWAYLEDLLEKYIASLDGCNGECSSCQADCDSRFDSENID